MRARLLIFFLLALPYGQAHEIVKTRLVNNVVLVPVRVNGRVLSFLLDTGSDSSAIDKAAASALGLSTQDGAGILKNYRIQTTGVTGAVRMDIGQLTFNHANLTVVSMGAVSRALGVAVDGVLGNDILQDFPFQLNYSRQELHLVSSREVEHGGVPVTLRRSGNEFFVPLQIASLPVDLLLDTGTNSTNLSWRTWQRLSSVWTPGTIIDGVVRAGFPAPSAFMVCLPSTRLGNFALADQAVRVQRAVGSGAFSENDFGGILGSELLRQFEVTYDLKHDRILLKRDLQFKPDAYRYATVGIQFARNDQSTYSVMAVWRNSPADEAGIRLGDRIKAVNGESTVSMSIEQVSAQLRGEEGTLVNLIIERDGASSAVALHTRQMLCGSKSTQTELRSRK